MVPFLFDLNIKKMQEIVSFMLTPAGETPLNSKICYKISNGQNKNPLIKVVFSSRSVTDAIR